MILLQFIVPHKLTLQKFYYLASILLLVEAAGAYYDLNYHILNIVDTFFQPAHLLIYSALAGITVIGGVIVAMYRKYVLLLLSISSLSVGYGDLLWHDAFGFDGLLSPPHIVLTSLQLGIAYYLYRNITEDPRKQSIALSAIWLAGLFICLMLGIPASKTKYFDFNPPSVVAIAIGAFAMPFVSAMVIKQCRSLLTLAIYAAIIIPTCMVYNHYNTFELPVFLIGVAIPAFLLHRNQRELAIIAITALSMAIYLPFALDVIEYGVHAKPMYISNTYSIFAQDLQLSAIFVAAGGMVGLWSLTSSFTKLLAITQVRSAKLHHS
jgi:hypothetical protein